jgi:protein-tyrosine phosphatase
MAIGVLFVCTGNICRSPTAEGVFRSMAREAGLEAAFTIDSAGTYGGHEGEPPSRLAIEAAARRGYDVSGLRARLVTAADIARFDHVLAMDRGHMAQLRRLAPRALIGRLRMFAATDVADPYGGNARDYERALDAIEAGCRDLLATLTPEAKAQVILPPRSYGGGAL